MKDGVLRTQIATWFPIFGGVVVFGVLSCTGFSVITYWPNTPNVLKLLAGLSAILSASSYNLRLKALDYSIKLVEQGFSPEQVKENMGKTSCTLTNLVLLSFLTSIFLFFSTKTILQSYILEILYYPYLAQCFWPVSCNTFMCFLLLRSLKKLLCKINVFKGRKSKWLKNYNIEKN